MKIHAEPRVVLVWRPSLIAEGAAELLASYGTDAGGWRRDPGDGDGDGIPELYGRMCYSSFAGLQGRVGAKAYHAHILESGHGSVLETATWGFAVLGASRGFLAQATRHRAGFAFAAESTHFERYSDAGIKGSVEPAVCLAGVPDGPAREFAIQECAASVRSYERLWEVIRATLPADAKAKKIVSGAARGLLPTALECRLGFTANARALRHFCELRGDPANTVEIRIVAARVAEIMIAEAPAIFQDFRVSDGADGWPIVESGHRKV